MRSRLLAARGQHDDRHVAGLLAAAQAAADLDAGELRQHPVEQDEIGLFLGGDQQRLLAVLRLEHAIAFALQIVAQQRDQRAFVFGDQDGRLQAHAFVSKGTLVSLVVSALGRSVAR